MDLNVDLFHEDGDHVVYVEKFAMIQILLNYTLRSKKCPKLLTNIYNKWFFIDLLAIFGWTRKHFAMYWIKLKTT